jgi:hypothetical protein
MSHFIYAQLIREPGDGKNLFISGQIFAHNLSNLKDHQIGAICSIGSDPFNFPPNI